MAGRTSAHQTSVGLSQFEVTDFSGGLNLRDAPSELAPNESPDCMNVTLDERGGVVKRLGLSTLTSSLSNAPGALFSSKALALDLVQDGTTLKKTTDWVSFTNVRVFSTSAACGMCDFGGKLMIVHPIDGFFTYDGTTLTAIGSGPKGTMVVGWQGKVHVAGDPGATRTLYASGVQDPTDWNTVGTGGAYTNQLAEGPYASLAITALAVSGGMDDLGRPTLLAYKERGLHRVNSSAGTTAGSYTTLSTTAGAAGPQAVTALLGRTISVNSAGLWETDGVAAPILVSAKLQPLFTRDELNLSIMSGAAAGTLGQRAVFSIPFGTSATANTLTLEYSPLVGWIVTHDFGMKCFTTNYSSTEKLYGAATATGRVSQVFKSWADNGGSITSRYQTRWFSPNADDYARIRRLRLTGRGTFDLYFKHDYEISDGIQNAVQLVGNAFTWGTGVWGVGVWGPDGYEYYQDFHSLGIGRAISFLFKETSTTSASGPKLLQTGAVQEVGSFAVYGLQIQHVPLGAS